MDQSTSSGHATPSSSRLLALTIGAVGVVYGDIGTSPLYSLKECFSPHYGLTPGAPEVLGILSLIFWALTLIISIKYLLIVTRFDNQGEGGILALMELVSQRKGSYKRVTPIVAMGLIGCALLYGDGIIAPSISVLSAVEGLQVAVPGTLNSFIVPITIALLLGLFSIQRFGTAGVGRVFGPVMIGWFAILAVVGVYNIAQTPDVFMAVNPMYALDFITNHGFMGFAVLGSVFLVVTGGESLYIDMGHFGRRPIMRGWFYVAYPALMLQYFGQGALLLREGHIASTVQNPFFHMVPSWAVIPLVLCATVATIIASQAVISGAFSLTWQALQLGFLPRMKVLHTSSEERGQIYMPTVNWVLFVSCAVLVIQFRTSGALAAAYGIAVTSTMVITTILAWFAMRRLSNWNLAAAVAVTAIFLIIDGSFFAANFLKFFDGGYVPITMAAVTFLVMVTWHKGRTILGSVIEKRSRPLIDVVHEEMERCATVPGSALYMTGYKGIAPPALVSNLRYNRSRHENVILLTVIIDPAARVPASARIERKPMENNVFQVVLHYGFMDQLNLMQDLMLLPEYDIPVDVTDAIFVLGHETLTVQDGKGMARWRKELFVFLHRNSRTPSSYFGIPVKRTLEVGSHVGI
jgi:KUP system potassium uptake protein